MRRAESAGDASRVAELAVAIVPHVEARAREFFPELTGRPRARLVGHVLASSDVLFLAVEGDGRSRTVAAKIPRLPDPEHEGRREFEQFGRFNAARARGDIACPRPLAYVEPLHALLTEAVNGVGLRDAFRRRNVTELVRRCAAWLATYHALASERVLPLGDLYFNYVRQYIGYLAGAVDHAGVNRFPVSSALRRELEQVVGRIDAARRDLTTRHVVGHGDFGPANVLVADDRIVGLDCTSAHLRPALEDIAFFFVTAVAPAARRRGAPPAERLEAAFFESYEHGPGEPRDSPLLDVFRLQAHLKQWSNRCRRANAFPAPASSAATRLVEYRSARRLRPILDRLARAV